MTVTYDQLIAALNEAQHFTGDVISFKIPAQYLDGPIVELHITELPKPSTCQTGKEELGTVINIKRFNPYDAVWPNGVISPDNKYDPANAWIETIRGRQQITPGMWILTDISGKRDIMPDSENRKDITMGRCFCGSISGEDGLCWYHRDGIKLNKDEKRKKELTVHFLYDNLPCEALQITQEILAFNGWVLTDWFHNQLTGIFSNTINKEFVEKTYSEWRDKDKGTKLSKKLGYWMVRLPEYKAILSQAEFDNLLSQSNVSIVHNDLKTQDNG